MQTIRNVSPLIRRLAALLILSAAASVSAAPLISPVGLWQTTDDHTGRPAALVRVTQQSDGTMSGAIVKGLDPGNPLDYRCTKCTDYRKDQPALGMTFIDGLRQNGDQWDGGHLVDPATGSIYKCEMHLEDGGQKLVVRGYIGVSLLGRSQTWLRQQ